MYKARLQKELLKYQELSVREALVEDLVVEKYSHSSHSATSRCSGVVLKDGSHVSSSSVILTTGTFLRGVINVGLDFHPAGRLGEAPSQGLAATLQNAGFRLGRLKTGTPARIKAETVDFDTLEPLKGDAEPIPFSFLNQRVWLMRDEERRPQMLAHVVHTNEATEKLVRDNLHLSRHVQEEVVGPRYCPSIESKVTRFPGRQHQIILEPEGFNSPLVYPQNLAATLPPNIQLEMIRTLRGLGRAEMALP